MNTMEFCDLECKYARFPKSDAVDGSRSCRTFVALLCTRKKKLVHKNLPCGDKVRKNDALLGRDRRALTTFCRSWQKMP